MTEDLIQLSISRPTDIGAGCALLGGTEKPLACLSPDSDSSRDFGSEEVYPGRIWAILKKKKSEAKNVRPHRVLLFLLLDTDRHTDTVKISLCVKNDAIIIPPLPAR
eukprot:COSAG05_NODE_827_length_7101_cov_4.580834_1_plen_107_part_00